MIAPSSSKDSFLPFQTKKLIRSGNRGHNGGFCCLEPLEQRAFVSDYNWFSRWGRFSGVPAEMAEGTCNASGAEVLEWLPWFLSRVATSRAPGSEAGRASGQVWGPPGQFWKSCGDCRALSACNRSLWSQPH